MAQSKFFAAAHFLVNHPAYKSAPFLSWRRAANWYLRVSLGLTPARSLPRWNLRVQLPRKYRTPAKVFYVFGERYDENLHSLPELLEQGDVFVDAGANFGIYSLLAAKIVGASGCVFAFEPIPELCELLRTNVEKNNLPMLRVMELALGGSTGTASLALHADLGRSSLRPMKHDVSGSIKVRMSSLDHEIAASLTVSLIKLDVEGFEVAVLKGASRILGRDRPIILFENNPDALSEADASTDALLREMRGFGYEFYETTAGGTLLRTEPIEFGNFLAIHKEDPRLPRLLAKA